MKKKILSIFILCALSILMLAACGTEKTAETAGKTAETDKIRIVATLFPSMIL